MHNFNDNILFFSGSFSEKYFPKYVNPERELTAAAEGRGPGPGPARARARPGPGPGPSRG